MVRNIGDWLSRLSSVRPPGGASPRPRPEREPAGGDTVVASRALQQFLAYLGSRPAPVLLDLGPTVGSNVTFYAGHLGGKVLVDDLFVDLERHTRNGLVADLPAFLSTRFKLDPEAVDGVLLWDLFDYLDRDSARALAAVLVRALRTDGALLGFFGSAGQAGAGATKFVIVDDAHVRQQPLASSMARQARLQNRDIIKMFDGLRVSDSYLLKSGRREMLFRKGGVGRPVI